VLLVTQPLGLQQSGGRVRVRVLLVTLTLTLPLTLTLTPKLFGSAHHLQRPAAALPLHALSAHELDWLSWTSPTSL
jgi:hypothetical protein